ncbi:MAG: hypothetical protein ACLQGP_16720 [Isosphaeraceae bacterium]
MELREALTQITEIRLQLARTEVFRGYRAMPVAFSGGVALLAALIQGAMIADPMQQIGPYLALWIGAAVISGTAAGVEMVVRARNAGSPMTRELTWLALEQFCPCLLAGALLTIVLVRASTSSLWMLPGLWQVVYSLGIFASCRLLPRATFWVAVFYLGTGLAVLSLGSGVSALSPWTMGLPFGAGQLLAAAVLYSTLERDHGTE